MVHFTVHSGQLSERDIYVIDEVKSLSAFLKPERSLCLVHDPVWSSGSPELLRVSGRRRNGEPDNVYLAEAPPSSPHVSSVQRDPGYYRCLLGKVLASPFLFASGKKSGCHQVSIVKKGHDPIRFNSFDEALNAYLPEGFIPAYSFRRKPVFVLMFLAMQRRQLLSNLLAELAGLRELKKRLPSPAENSMEVLEKKTKSR